MIEHLGVIDDFDPLSATDAIYHAHSGNSQRKAAQFPLDTCADRSTAPKLGPTDC
jgi:hypothetical protein